MMFRDLPRYVSYTPAGDWLGEIPSRWAREPARMVFAERKETGFADEQMLSVTIGRGVIRQADLLASTAKKDSSTVDKSKYKLVEPGDLVYNKMRAWQGASGGSGYRGIVSPAYIVMTPRSGLTEYFHHVVRTPMFAKEAERWSYGITSDQWSLRPEHFKMIRFPVPPADQQAAIVKYLAHANARIDKAISAKRRLIALLKEQHRVEITEQVRGVSGPDGSSCPLDNDWQSLPIKAVASIIRGRFTHRPRNDPSLYGGDYPFIQTGDVARAGKYITGFEQTLNDEGAAVSKMFPAGTLTMAIAANIGDVSILTFDACFPDSVVGFVPRDLIALDYLYYCFVAMKDDLRREAPVSTQGNLNVQRVGRMVVALPSRAQQAKIVARIEAMHESSEVVIQKAHREMALLQEFRTRLVADVVSGQIDVRAIAATLPDAPEAVADLASDSDDELEGVAEDADE